jgi:hypothetical protein
MFSSALKHMVVAMLLLAVVQSSDTKNNYSFASLDYFLFELEKAHEVCMDKHGKTIETIATKEDSEMFYKALKKFASSEESPWPIDKQFNKAKFASFLTGNFMKQYNLFCFDPFNKDRKTEFMHWMMSNTDRDNFGEDKDDKSFHDLFQATNTQVTAKTSFRTKAPETIVAKTMRALWRTFFLNFEGFNIMEQTQAQYIRELVYPHRNPKGFVYGLSLDEFYGLGHKMTGRTIIEVTQDDFILGAAEKFQEFFTKEKKEKKVNWSFDAAMDPMAGSGASLFAFAKQLNVPGVGHELAPTIFANTDSAMEDKRVTGDVKIVMHKYDFATALLGEVTERNIQYSFILGRFESFKDMSKHPAKHVAVFLSPPWGPAMQNGELDIAATTPPVLEVVQSMKARLTGEYKNLELHFAIQIKKNHNKDSVNALYQAMEIKGQFQNVSDGQGILIFTIKNNN